MKRGYDQVIAAPPNLRAVVVLEEEDGTTLEVALPIVAIAFSGHSIQLRPTNSMGSRSGQRRDRNGNSRGSSCEG
jgi:hypothetical protein